MNLTRQICQKSGRNNQNQRNRFIPVRRKLFECYYENTKIWMKNWDLCLFLCVQVTTGIRKMICRSNPSHIFNDIEFLFFFSFMLMMLHKIVATIVLMRQNFEEKRNKSIQLSHRPIDLSFDPPNVIMRLTIYNAEN